MMNPDEMRVRFHQLRRWIEEVEAGSAPLREQHTAMVREHEAQQQALSERIKGMEAGLFDAKNEMAMISRALNGQTGKVSEHG